MEQDFTTPMNGNGHAADSAHDSINKMAGAARPAVDRFAAGAHSAVDRLAGVAQQAAEKFGMRGEQLKGTQERLMDEARIYIRNKPATAVGIAVAAGFVLSRLLRSR